MNDQKTSAFAVVYKDEQFIFQGKKYNVQKLMHLGFLLCDHFTADEQAKELWHLINPKLAETVSKD
jgi:hypothetical protein